VTVEEQRALIQEARRVTALVKSAYSMPPQQASMDERLREQCQVAEHEPYTLIESLTAALEVCLDQQKEPDVGAGAAFVLARYVMKHHGCETYTPNTDDDACGGCIPCHAVGVYEGDEDSYVALAALAAGGGTE
jgi:hypothetical protein